MQTTTLSQPNFPIPSPWNSQEYILPFTIKSRDEGRQAFNTYFSRHQVSFSLHERFNWLVLQLLVLSRPRISERSSCPHTFSSLQPCGEASNGQRDVEATEEPALKPQKKHFLTCNESPTKWLQPRGHNPPPTLNLLSDPVGELSLHNARLL